ncbi:hypothetical protein DPMN_150812 [Dreissena polymorpha]|uniref:Uncharacterized protein n=1 Tax=Dreissena polymorpha TaxID=45954 RepID=A0A9D4FIP6_DREPO|nr:hypothetical protein DPMN_150812 [Dreissena polymorpha]
MAVDIDGRRVAGGVIGTLKYGDGRTLTAGGQDIPSGRVRALGDVAWLDVGDIDH